MKKLMLILMVVAVSLTANSTEIEFLNSNWEKVIKKAKIEKKIIFVDAYASWCGPCKWMEENVFSNKEIASFFNENFINARFDMESDLGIEFEKNFEITAYPTLLFISHEGELIKKRVGALDAEEFLKLANGILNPEETEFFKLSAEYKNGNRSKEFLVKYALAYLDEGEEITDEIFAEYFKDLSNDSLMTENSFIMFYLDKDDITSFNSKYFAENYDEFSLTFGEYAEEKFFAIIEEGVNMVIDNKIREKEVFDYIEIAFADDKEFVKEINQTIKEYIKEQE